jgi:A/G-specific adenine glycosylase
MHHMSEEDKDNLINWYKANQRDLPWRVTKDPWHVLLSEILLQQTQMSRGLEYWKNIVERFPTIVDLAHSDVEDLLLLWQGAGYYARARRLHACAQVVLAEHEGIIPSSYDTLLSLPGIGPYTAAAVASIAFDQPHACVDGNIRRVMSRWCEDEEPSERNLRHWADTQLKLDDAGQWNQALMELGALVCSPKKPACDACPISQNCRGKQRPTQYPRPKKRLTKHVKLTAILEIDGHGLPRLYNRPSDGLFGGMYGPKIVEGDLAPEHADFLGVIHHSLSHREFEISVFTMKVDDGGKMISSYPLSTMDLKILAKGGVI